MGRIFILIGKSASGKDAVYRRLIRDRALALQPYVGYTTRPIRAGEQNGREYFFITPQQLHAYEQEGRVIEKRTYHTVHGDWHYCSVDTESVDLNRYDYLYIGTLESYVAIRDYYGADRVIPVYIQVEDGERLKRAIAREEEQEAPRYEEMCRRFLADAADFREDKLKQAGITQRFDNHDLEDCITQIAAFIAGKKTCRV